MVFDPGENHSVRALDEETVFVGFLRRTEHTRRASRRGVGAPDGACRLTINLSPVDLRKGASLGSTDGREHSCAHAPDSKLSG